MAEGQVVHVHSEKALEARKGVLEMLLINHPLDCPICDQAGECELQDYTYQEGRAEGRYRDPKRFNPVEDFGGDVMYTPNRCILCTRCVRFMEDVAHDPVLNVSERGDRAFIGKFEGKDLTHPWAGNVIDLCPVGALLSKDSLNKARAWELDRTASVCPGCSQGCNTIVETRDNMVVRLRPRPNDDVNKYFMCDHGRLNYRWMNRQDRVDVPMVRHGATLARHRLGARDRRSRAGAPRQEGVRARVADRCRTKRCSCSPSWWRRRAAPGAFRVQQGEEAPLPGVEDLSLRADRAANVTRRRAVWLHAQRHAARVARRRRRACRRRRRVGWRRRSGRRQGRRDHRHRHDASARGRGMPPPSFFRSRTSPKKKGRSRTFVAACSASCRRRRRRASRGRVGTRCPTCSHALGAGTNYSLASDVFGALAQAHPAFAGMSYDTLGAQGSHDRRRDGGSGVMTLFALLQTAAAARRRRRSSTCRSRRTAASGSSPRS